jgi:hypothetical protein
VSIRSKTLRKTSSAGYWECAEPGADSRDFDTSGQQVSCGWLSRTIAFLGWRFPLVHEFLRETRSYLHRIRTLSFQGSVVSCDIGPLAGVDRDGNLVACTRTHGRTLDTQSFAIQHPWACQQDLALYLAGWNAGARYADDTIHSCIPRKHERIPACMQPLPETLKRISSRSLRGKRNCTRG